MATQRGLAALSTICSITAPRSKWLPKNPGDNLNSMCQHHSPRPCIICIIFRIKFVFQISLNNYRQLLAFPRENTFHAIPMITFVCLFDPGHQRQPANLYTAIVIKTINKIALSLSIRKCHSARCRFPQFSTRCQLHSFAFRPNEWLLHPLHNIFIEN